MHIDKFVKTDIAFQKAIDAANRELLPAHLFIRASNIERIVSPAHPAAWNAKLLIVSVGLAPADPEPKPEAAFFLVGGLCSVTDANGDRIAFVLDDISSIRASNDIEIPEMELIFANGTSIIVQGDATESVYQAWLDYRADQAEPEKLPSHVYMGDVRDTMPSACCEMEPVTPPSPVWIGTRCAVRFGDVHYTVKGATTQWEIRLRSTEGIGTVVLMRMEEEEIEAFHTAWQAWINYGVSAF